MKGLYDGGTACVKGSKSGALPCSAWVLRSIQVATSRPISLSVKAGT